MTDVRFITIGVGPRTAPHRASHTAIVAVRVWGLVMAKRALWVRAAWERMGAHRIILDTVGEVGGRFSLWYTPTRDDCSRWDTRVSLGDKMETHDGPDLAFSCRAVPHAE